MRVALEFSIKEKTQLQRKIQKSSTDKHLLKANVQQKQLQIKLSHVQDGITIISGLKRVFFIYIRMIS